MATITWRNIDSDTTRGAAGLMEVARRAFGDGMSNFQSIVDSRNENEANNWQAQKQVNTNAFLDRLAQFKTPEELAAAQASGELNALKQQFGGQVDSAAIRGAEGNQADVLMKRIAAQNQYGDDQINRDARPKAAIFDDLIAAGKLKEAAAYKAQEVLGVDESTFTNRLLERGDKEFSQGIQSSNLDIAQAGNRRAQVQFDDTMNETLQKRAVLGGVQAALSGAPDLASANSAFSQWAKDNNLRADHVAAGLQQMQGLYTQATGLTPEQDTEVSSYVAPYTKAAELAEKHAEGFQVFSNPEVKNMTEMQALAKVLPRVEGEQEDTMSKLQTKIAEFREKYEVPETTNLGAVLNEVLGATSKDDDYWDSGELNLDKFEANMKRVYGEFNRFEKAQLAARNARTMAEQEKLKKQNEFRTGNIRANLK